MTAKKKAKVTFRALVVDPRDKFCANRFCPNGQECEVDSSHHQPAFVGRSSISYYPTTSDLLEFAKKAFEGNYDVIIIGNMQGSGIRRVEALDKSLISKVVIVFNWGLNPHEDDSYRKLGVTRFSRR
jgi:hypothetical protein